MTIIQPNKHKKEIAWTMTLIGLGVIAFSTSAMTVFSYSKIAGLRHDISKLETDIDTARAKNADLGNSLFKMTDPQSLESIAAEKGLVEDRNPKWVFASL